MSSATYIENMKSLHLKDQWILAHAAHWSDEERWKFVRRMDYMVEHLYLIGYSEACHWKDVPPVSVHVRA